MLGAGEISHLVVVQVGNDKECMETGKIDFLFVKVQQIAVLYGLCSRQEMDRDHGGYFRTPRGDMF